MERKGKDLKGMEKTMEETMRPRSLGMLLPCLRIQYLFFAIDI